MPQFIIADNTHHNHAIAVARLDTLMQDYADLQQASRARLGSMACRYLLTLLQQKMGLSGKLQDEALPYRIESNDLRQPTYYVSFSHSREHVAVLLATTPWLGIDIEDKTISLAVAKRYFTANEISWVVSVPTCQQPQATKLLWTLKEALIKQQEIIISLENSKLEKRKQEILEENKKCLENKLQLSQIIKQSELKNEELEKTKQSLDEMRQEIIKDRQHLFSQQQTLKLAFEEAKKKGII